MRSKMLAFLMQDSVVRAVVITDLCATVALLAFLMGRAA